MGGWYFVSFVVALSCIYQTNTIQHFDIELRPFKGQKPSLEQDQIGANNFKRACEDKMKHCYHLKAYCGHKSMKDNCPQTCRVCKGPIDGGYFRWSDWGVCTRTCGSGIQQRSRSCDNPRPQNGGRGCKRLGQSMQYRYCNKQPCKGNPVDGGYSNWSDWSSCDSKCGMGQQWRFRSCNNPKPKNGGKDCKGEFAQDRLCEKPPCQGCNIESESRHCSRNKFRCKNHDFEKQCPFTCGWCTPG